MEENTQTKTSETALTNADEKKVIYKPLFILFAEFFGYVSPLIDWAEDICDGKDVPEFKKNIVNIDADYIFSEMKKEYTLTQIRAWYDEFYPIILKDYVNKLKAKNIITI